MPYSPGTSKRKGGKKVKTGCMTCRARRVKCDETKPGCLRCQKLGQECDGYRPNRRPTSGNQWNITSMQSIIFPASPTTEWRELTYSMSEEEQDLLYFQVYQDYSAEINGPFNSDVWTDMALQASNENESVRYAVVALGALYKSQEYSPPSTPQSESEARQNIHHECALVAYQKAIVCLREALQKSDASPKVALIACMLFVCFELTEGNHKAALSQALSGIRLLQERKDSGVSCHSNDDSMHSSGTSIDEHLSQMFAQAVWLAEAEDKKGDSDTSALKEQEYVSVMWDGTES